MRRDTTSLLRQSLQQRAMIGQSPRRAMTFFTACLTAGVPDVAARWTAGVLGGDIYCNSFREALLKRVADVH